MKKHIYEIRGKCYVLLRSNVQHPIARERWDMVWYPESNQNLLQQIQYRPYEKSVVTESPWIIAMYDREDIYIWRDGIWRHPNIQTYGASIDMIYHSILGIPTHIPAMAYDGGEQMKKFQSDYEKTIPKL